MSCFNVDAGNLAFSSYLKVRDFEKSAFKMRQITFSLYFHIADTISLLTTKCVEVH